MSIGRPDRLTAVRVTGDQLSSGDGQVFLRPVDPGLVNLTLVPKRARNVRGKDHDPQDS